MYEEIDSSNSTPWQKAAGEWLTQVIEDHGKTHLPVIEVSGDIVASAVGLLEIGVPNPHSSTGRGVRLMNVVTLPAHRRNGYAKALINSVIQWGQKLEVDRIDLSATPEGERLYKELGFTVALAPRMKRIL
jgi:GNAT superfamily N-acetyltransferase